ncbi:MAG: T9SS type A sorting domain-containing protein [Saprospiraceae bacterium]
MKKVRLLSLFSLLCFFGIGNNLHAQCESTTIQTSMGTTMAYTCPGDGNDDLIDFENSGNGTTDYVYVATDQSNNILGVNPTATFNFEGAGTGTCYIWGFSYTGDLTAQVGDFLWNTPISNGCFQISDNRVNIIRDMPDGGTINNNAGSNSISVCTTDEYSDVVNFNRNTSSNSAYTYVITDANNNILGMTNENSFDFNGVPAGTCRIWGLSFSGNLSLVMGNNAATSDLSDGCFDLSDNFIEVTRIDVDGGNVADANGATNLTICAGDDLADVVNFTHTTNSGATYGYIITDDNNNVLGVPPGNSQDFNGAGQGICRVWGISYTGSLTVFGGDNIFNKTLSDDCFDLSENFIEVVRTGVEGGTVYTTDSETMVYTCPGDGVDDVLSFMHSSTTGNFIYVITDTDGNILGLPPGNSQNFEGAGSGTCLVWGLSYTGNISVMVGDNALTSALSDGCFALSTNFVTVVRDMPDGGTVNTTDGATTVYTCPGNGINDIIEFAHISGSNSNYAYVITDEDNNILGLPAGNFQNFEGAGVATCRVWGLSYTGNITASGGDNAATATLTDGCFELSSNFITVVREQPDAGTLDANGAMTVYTCPGDGNDDVIDFTADGFNQNYQLVITDENYNILGLPTGNSQNFEGAGVGVCLAWGVSYTGNIVASAGDNIFGTQFSSDCWDFSDPVRVIRDTPDGGTVNNNSGNNEVTVCTTDGNADVISYTHTTSSNSAYTYLITDADNNILGIHPLPDFDFEGVPAGVCRIWGLSYSGNLIATVGNNAATSSLSEGCAELSSNFIEVTRTDVDGGTVAMPSGATAINTCTQDGDSDIIMFTHASNSSADYRYIITDSDNNVLGLPPGDSQDFDGAPAGICRVWGLSYTGDVTLFVGDNILNKSLSTDCYDLSDNYISVIREDCSMMDCTVNSGNIAPTDALIYNRVVVANRASGTISVIDGDAGILLENYEMPDDGQPMYVVHNSKNNTVLVGDYNGKVVAFDGKDFSVKGIATAGAGVFHMWLSPNGNQLWVNNELDKTVSVINPNNMETIITFDIPSDIANAGFKPHDVIVSPDNSSAFVTMINGNEPINYVVKYDASSFSEIQRAEVGGDPHVSLTSSNDLLYVASQASGSLQILNRADLSSVAEIAVPNAHGLGMNSEGTYLYISNISDGGVDATYTLDLATNTLVGSPVDAPYAAPHNYSVGSDDSKLYLTHSGGSSDKLSIYDLSPIPTLVGELTLELNPFGLVAYHFAETSVYTCPGDGISDAFDVELNNNTGSSAWVITDTDGNILGVPPGPPFDLEGAGEGTCIIWHVSHGNDFGGAVMGNNAFTDLTGCYNLSNPITVYRDTPDGGTVQTTNGETEVAIIAGDGIDDIIEFESLGTSNSKFTYVITDDQNNILGVPPGNSQNFEGAGVGVCRVWGLSYTGNILASAGDNAATAILTDDCFSLSSNFIEVTRSASFTNPGGNTFAANKTNTNRLDLSIAPNPATDFINVTIDRNFTQSTTAQLQILNLQGQVILNRKFDVEEISANGLELNISSFNAGVYFLNLKANDENITKRFVKF